MKVKREALTTALLVMFAILSFGCSRGGQNLVAADAAATPTPCPCGPDVCLNDPRYPPKLAKKKAAMKGKFPDELIALLDRDGKCVMAVEQGPDSFRLLVVAPNGDNKSIEWTQEHEDLARKQVLSGELKAYYKHNVRKVFACCQEPKAEERPDWDADLGLSRRLSIVCTKQGGSVVCQ